MNFYVWPANLIDESRILGESSSTTTKSNVSCIVANRRTDQHDIAEKKSTSCLYLNDGCVYEATFPGNSIVDDDGRTDSTTNDSNSTSSTISSLVFAPLAKFRVLSIHCAYGVFGAITSSNHAYLWGNSEKGQCGVVTTTIVEKPHKINLKTAEIVCEHGARELGRELQVRSLAFTKTSCLAVCSKGSLWTWGAQSSLESPQIEPSRVVTLYGRRVLSVACGESHHLALVANEIDHHRRTNQQPNAKSSSASSSNTSSPEFGLLNFVDSCAKCRELRAKREREAEDRGDEDDVMMMMMDDADRWESTRTNASTEVNFDDSTIFCPLGLRLELSLGGSSPPPDQVDDSGVSFPFDDDSTSLISLKNKRHAALLDDKRRQHPACSLSMAGDVVGFRPSSLSRQRLLERGHIEMSEMRKTKSVGTRFSFTSFEFNAAEISSSSGSSGGGGGGRGANVIGECKAYGENGGDDISWASFSSNSLFRPKSGRRKSGQQSTAADRSSVQYPINAEVWSWGDNSCGQLGLGDFMSRTEPCRLDKLKDACITKLDAGAFHSLALSSIGEVWTWGSNSCGQIKQANVDMQPIPSVMKVGSQSSVLDCTAGPDFTVLLVNGLDYRTDLYYCGRDHSSNVRDEANVGSGVAVRLSSVHKNRWPISLDCTADLVIAQTRDCQESPALQRLLELVCSEIKFAFKLKKLHTFAANLWSQHIGGQNDDGLLLRAYADELERFFAVVLQGALAMKSELRRTSEPLVASKVFGIVCSTAYGTMLKRIHSINCQMMAANVFSNISLPESLEKSLMDLSVVNDIESSKPYRLLRKLFYVPFTRLDECCKLAQNVMQDQSGVSSDEHDRLVQFVKQMKILEQLLLNHYHLAENTGHFWSRITGKSSVPQLKLSNRFLIKEFAKINGVHGVLENGTSVSWQQVLVFSDSVAFVLRSTNKVLELPLVWIVPLDIDNKYSVQLVAPESIWTVELADGLAKNDFVQCCNQAIVRHQTGHYTDWTPGGSPPLRRIAHYKFSPKHQLYGDARYIGSWAQGKPHGRGEMEWNNGRKFNGKFKNGLMHGLGELRVIEMNGGQTITKAHWKDGSLTGLAIIDHANGSKYEGYLKNGLRCGHGVLKQRSFLYVGAWNNDVRHGYGVLDKGKEKYMGMWETDVESGLGTLVTLEGDYCEGTFERSVFLKGKMITPDGTKYDGDFNGFGVMSGKGTIHLANGDTVTGTLHGGVNDQLKITNGIFKKSSESVTTPINNTWLDCSPSMDDQPALPADHKWTDIFAHVYENLGIDPHGHLPNEERLWENMVATLERLKAFFNERKYSNATSIEKVPNWNRPLDASYLAMVSEYCTKAFAVPYHPFGRLLCGLTDVFNACYSGVGAHAKLLPHAVAEILSVIRRMYQVVRYLFPSLPPENQLDSLIGLQEEESQISSYETYGSMLYDTFLQRTYPNLFTLYVCRNEALDRVYMEKIASLNLKNDVALLDYLGVCRALWPIELKNTEVLDAPLVCATARKKYYADAIDCLQRLSSEFYPSAKLRVIVETFDNITKCVSRLASEPEDKHTWTADSLVPVTTYVIVRAQIQRLGAEIQLTENFCPQLGSLGEVQYMFTMLQGCYQHIVQNKNLG